MDSKYRPTARITNYEQEHAFVTCEFIFLDFALTKNSETTEFCTRRRIVKLRVWSIGGILLTRHAGSGLPAGEQILTKVT